MRVAAWHTDLSRKGPGLLLRDILSDKDPQVGAVVAVVAQTRPDVLLLSGIDIDHGGVALAALVSQFGKAGVDYPHHFAPMSNRGLATGIDLDGDGRAGGPEDAQGYGRFAGDGAMAILSRYPVDLRAVRDFSALLWRDLPGGGGPPALLSDQALAVQRLSTSGHWVVPLILPGDRRLGVLAWAATPPLFGSGDRNLRRNHDETALWLALLAGQLGPPPVPPFVAMGLANIDPQDGAGDRAALRALLAHPALQDPRPSGRGGGAAALAQGGANIRHSGDPALDTADYRDTPGPGNLRVGYVLPSADLRVVAAGVVWPPPDDPLAGMVARAGTHRMVWVDLDLSGN